MLMVEVLLTRITSVIAQYHLAFFVIALAMLGMTAGAIFVFLRPNTFDDASVGRRMTASALGFAITTPLAFAYLMSGPLLPVDGMMQFVALFGFGAIAAVPFFLIGITLTLALTRAGLPAGQAYGADLCGAAAGCLLIVPLLDITDAPSAVLMACTLAAVAALCLAFAELRKPTDPAGSPPRGRVVKAGLTVFALASVTWFNHATEPHPLRPLWSRGVKQVAEDFSYVGWNTHSRITVAKTKRRPPAFWARAANIPQEHLRNLPSRRILIDGGAATRMFNFRGDLDNATFIEYDLPGFAHNLRKNGAAAVIGVGGGRDVLSAARAGHDPIVGIEINSRIIDLHQSRMKRFSGLAKIPGVELVNDEARSFLTRDDRSYDVITMSLIDTWAASGAGAYSLTENSLYTVDGWVTFFRRLKPDGIFTVSRWHGRKAGAGETVRMLALAMDALWEVGADRPADHIIVLLRKKVATLLVSPQPFSPTDIETTHREAERIGYEVLLTPEKSARDPILAEVLAIESRSELASWTRAQTLDMSPPTDDRPFFFNMLRMNDWLADKVSFHDKDLTIRGNLQATKTLVHATLVSVLLTMVALLWPLWTRRSSLREIPGRQLLAASSYFGLIGLGFMFVEIGLLSRLNVFLGHPVLALAVSLGGIILATGLGSLASERIPMDKVWWARLYPLLPAITTLVAFQLLEPMMDAYAGAETSARIIASLVIIFPPGLAMGLGFPLGLRLVEARTRGRSVTITPWMWGINGAFGVCASGLALGTSMSMGISTTLGVGTVCYLLLLACTWVLAPTPSAASSE